MIKRLLFSFIAIAPISNFLSFKANAQESYDASSPRTYYYNNLEGATAGSPGTYFAAGASTRSSAFIDIVSNSALNGTKSLSTTGGSTMGYLQWNFMANSTTGGGASLSTRPWEWEFDYRNTTGGATGNDVSVKMTAGADAWRFYLLAATYTADNYIDQNNANYTIGLYLTHYNGNLILRYKYGNAYNQYTDYASVSMPNNNHTYQIRVVRQGPNGYYKIFILDRSTLTTTVSADINVGSWPSPNYYLSFLQATSTSANRFQFDNFNFYRQRLDYTPISTSPAGVSNPIYPGMGNAIPFAVKVNVRGDVYMGRFVINYTGDVSKVFSGASLYKKAVGQTLSTTSATSLGNYSLNNAYTSQLDISSEYYYSGGGTDGSSVNVINYFLYTTVKSPFDSGAPTSAVYSVSNASNDTYNSFYQTDTGPYNSGSTVTPSGISSSGNVWDWQGVNVGWNSLGSWKLNGSATTSYPQTNTDIVRIGVTPTTFTYNPSMYTDYTVGSLTVGSTATLTITPSVATALMSPKLTLSTGLNISSGATFTVNGYNAVTSIVSNGVGSYSQIVLNSGSVSTMASTSRLNLIKAIVTNNSTSFTLSSDANGTASIGALTDGASKLTGTGYTVERYFTGGSVTNRGWRLVSSPVNNSSNNPLTTSSSYNFVSLKTNLFITGGTGTSAATALANGFDVPTGYTNLGATILNYVTATRSFTAITGVSTSVTNPVGKGFYFYYRGNKTDNALNKLVKAGSFAAPEANVVGLQSGTLNQGALTYTLSNASTGYNLVGNPYPSSISVTSTALTGTTGFIYTYAPGGGSIVPNSPPYTIASGQGFFLKSNSATSSVAFTEGLKTTGQPSTLLLGLPNENLESSVKLQMVHDSTNYDFVLLRFADKYSKNYIDTEDADDLNGSGQIVFLGAMTADKHLVAIASQPLDKKKTSVFLSVDDHSSGIYTLNKIDISHIPDRFDIWLIDHFKHDSLDLRSNISYTFNLDKNIAASFGNNRFEVVIRVKPLPPYQMITFTGKRNTGNNTLQWSTKNEYNYTYFELERSLDNINFAGINNSMSTSAGNYSFTDNVSSDQVFYRLKQTDINGKTNTSNLYLKANETSVFSLYPNPVNNMLRFDLKQDVKNLLNMYIYNSLGRLVKSSSFSTAIGEQDVSSLETGSYTVELIDNNSKKALASTKFVKF